MAKAKAFGREAVLKQAIPVFAGHGYAGSSTSVLLRAMGISRQSMYDTYGDKRRLYMEALTHSVAQNITRQLHALETDAANVAPIERLQALLDLVVAQTLETPAPPCLSVSSICEFGDADPAIHAVNEAAKKTLLAALEICIAEGQGAGQIDLAIDVEVAAQFVMASLAGIKLAARGGATQQNLRDIAAMVIRICSGGTACENAWQAK
jgi:TetR/AcrR family transcriptional repressor of nem operon